MRRDITKSSKKSEHPDVGQRIVQVRHLAHWAATLALLSALTGCGDGSSEDDTYTSTDSTTDNTPDYSISGTVSGLPAGQQIVMDDGHGGSHPLTYNGKYAFDVTAESVTLSISKQPNSAQCSLNITSNNLEELTLNYVDFQITCVPNS